MIHIHTYHWIGGDMKITKLFKKPEIPQKPNGCIVSILLDESAVRMCLKYNINASEFMRKCLVDEIHNQALIRESVYFERRE